MIGYKGTTKNTLVGIGKRIDDLCYQRNINYAELARNVHCDRKTIYKIIDCGNCNFDLIISIANYFGVSLDWLVFGKEKK